MSVLGITSASSLSSSPRRCPDCGPDVSQGQTLSAEGGDLAPGQRVAQADPTHNTSPADNRGSRTGSDDPVWPPMWPPIWPPIWWPDERQGSSPAQSAGAGAKAPSPPKPAHSGDGADGLALFQQRISLAQWQVQQDAVV